MKTKADIVKSITELNYSGDDGPVTICHSEIHECMDEYAEEYAKAFLMWYGRLPLESAENYIREFNHFKESLKK